MRAVDSILLSELVPHYHGKRGLRQHANMIAVGPYMSMTMTGYSITTPLRQAHFLAQVCEESYGLSDLKEEASGAEYEGRVQSLGNIHKGDGIKYKGRGLIQVTGRANYRRLGHELDLLLVSHPSLAEEPKISVEIACQYWTDHHLNILADVDDIKGITRRVNGHRMLGLKERTQYLVKAKALLGVPTPPRTPAYTQPK